MNLSGSVVSQFVNFYKLSVDDIMVISDDLDLLTGNYKLKSKKKQCALCIIFFNNKFFFCVIN